MGCAPADDDDAVEAARARDDRDAVRLAALATLRVALADAEAERDRQLTASLEAVANERARCAAVCREVAGFYVDGDVGSVVALACADEIERECVSAPSAHAGRLMRAPHSSRGNT
jgi:hypothetical protein